MKTVLKIVIIAVCSIALVIAIDKSTALINKAVNKTSFDMPAYHFKIKHTDALQISTIYSAEDYAVNEMASDTERVFLAVFKNNWKKELNEERLTYATAQKLDTIFFPALKEFELKQEKKPWYSCRITRFYSYSDGVSAKTVTIFARQYVYMFCQYYDAAPGLEDRLVDNFVSSRTFCIQNIFAVWRDRLSHDNRGWDFVLYFVVGMLILIWELGSLGLSTWLIYQLLSSTTKVFLQFSYFILVCFLFAFLTLHDYFADWIMSYGSFWRVPAGIFVMLFGGD